MDTEWNRNGHRRRQAVARQKRRSLTCHVCGQPIDPTIKTPHPDSFELDHVIPITAAGPIWDPTNHASAHRRCNRAKSGKTLDQARPPVTSRQW